MHVLEGFDLMRVGPGHYDLVCLPLRPTAATAWRGLFWSGGDEV